MVVLDAVIVNRPDQTKLCSIIAIEMSIEKYME